MTLHMAMMLFFAGIGGGMLTALVGGAAVITYPALIAAGIHPLAATTCNLTASFPGSMFAALSDRKQLPPFDRGFIVLIVASMLGAAGGAALLLLTPQRVFTVLVPLLLGFSTVLFALAGPIGAWLRQRARKQGREIDFSLSNLKMLLPVSFYGGYFGAGVGVLLLGILTVATEGDYRSANVTKNLVTSLNSGTAAAIFIAQGTIVWPQTLALMAGSIVGGLAGATLARIAPRKLMRIAVVLVGASLTAYFAARYWF